MTFLNLISLKALLFLCLFFTSIEFAHAEEYTFKHLLTKSGKKIQNIRSIVKDKKGYFWFAGDEGIARFDGNELVRVSKKPTGRIFLADNGDLWSSGTGTLTKFSINNFSSVSYPYIDFISQDTLSNSVYSHYSTTDGHQYFASDKGIAKLNTSSQKISVQPLKISNLTTNIFSSKPQVSATYLFPLAQNQLLLGTNQGLFIVSSSLLQSDSEIILSNPIIANSHINHILLNDNNEYLIGTNNGLYFLNSKFELQQHFPCLQQKNCHNPKEVSKSLIDGQGNIWVGTGTGLFIYDNKIKRFLHFKHETILSNSISNNFITDLQLDDLGNIIIATYSGVDYFDFQSLHSTTNRLASGQSFEINNVWSIAEDRQQQLWLGTFGAGLYRISQQGVTHFSIDVEKNNSLQDNVVPNLFFDSQNRFWIGTNSGLQRFDAQTNEFISYPIHNIQTNVPTNASTNTPMDEAILSISEDNEGNIWVGASTYFSKVDPVSKKTTVYNKKNLPEFRVNQWIRAIEPISNSLLLVGTDQGVQLINYQSKTVIHFEAPGYVIKILRDSRGDLWVLGEDGLYSFNERNMQLKRVAEQPTTASFKAETINGCNGMVEDNYRQLWMVCRNGLDVFDLRNREFIKNYSPHQNMDFSGFLTGGKSIIKNQSGDILAGMRSGVYRWTPSPLKINNQQPNTAITRVFLSYRSSDEQQNNPFSFVQSVIPKGNIQLSYQLQEISFHFSTLGISHVGSTQFQYRLLGYDKQWVNAEFKNLKAKYTNLTAAQYSFEVRSKYQDSEWDTDIYNFEVLQKPWLTWWAFLVYGLWILLMVIVLVKVRTHHLAVKRKELQNIIIARTRELAISKENIESLMQEKERLIENIYHQTKTPLQLMLGNLALLTDKQLSIKQFNHKQTNEIFKLSRLTEKALNISKSYELYNESINFAHLSELLTPLMLSYCELAKLKTINFQWSIDPSVIVTCQPIQIESLVENLLSNALKYTEKGSIKITIHANATHWFIECKDSGIGVSLEEKRNIFKRYIRASNADCAKGSGIGLAMVKQIIKQHQGSIKLDSQLSKGSCFEVKLPLKPYNFEKYKIEHPNDIIPDKNNNDHVNNNECPLLLASNEQSEEGKYLILLVEDNLELAAYLKKLLSHQYRTINALSAEEGLELATEWVPDLVISDVMMGEMDGYQLCSTIRENKITSHIPLILVTAKSDQQSRIKGFSVGANDFITKPFHQEMLLKRIASQLAHVQNVRQATIDSHQISITPVADSLITRFLCFVEANYQCAELRIKDVCTELHISIRQLERKVRYFIDMTPNEYINEYRLLRARELIQSGALIKQVFAECGFSSQAYFAKKYKQKFHLSPSQEQTKTTV